MQPALGIITPDGEGLLAAPVESAQRYALLQRLPSGLRSDIWLALADGGASLDAVVLLKIFVPHAPGPALEALTAELDLARCLSHENLAPCLRVGQHLDRKFIVKRYLEGATLQALLRWTELAGVRLASAAVARVLAALVAVVDHAERLGQNLAARLLSRQPIAVEDVFITRDGEVKVLGLKMPFGRRSTSGWSTATSLPPAIDELLSGHLTPELGAVLCEASRSSARVRAFERLRHLGEALRRWQTRVVGSDGQLELAALMHRMGASAALQRQAWLEAALAASSERAVPIWPDPSEEEVAPLSGWRRIGPGHPWAATSP
jgi:hypothetical protein